VLQGLDLIRGRSYKIKADITCPFGKIILEEYRRTCLGDCGNEKYRNGENKKGPGGKNL